MEHEYLKRPSARKRTESLFSAPQNQQTELRFPFHKGLLQTKLSVNAPGDRFEKEADRKADEIVNRVPAAPDNGMTDFSSFIQAGAIQTKAESNTGNSGRSLPGILQRPMESEFGQSMSSVRLHNDKKSEEMNSALGSRAFTQGNDIYFGKGEYNPGTREGLHLLSHELTHVVQQSKGQPTPAIQRKLVLTGSAADLNRTLQVINDGLGVLYTATLNARGELVISASGYQGPPTRETQFFHARLSAIVNEAATTTVSVVSGGRPIVGSYALQQIDIADIAALGVGQAGWDSRAALLHELVEQRQKQNAPTASGRAYGSASTGAHGEGLAAELGMIGAVLESDSGLVGASPGVGGTMNGTRTVVFRYPDGTRWRVTVTLTNNNITNVVRNQLP